MNSPHYRPDHHVLDRMEEAVATYDDGSTYLDYRVKLLDAMCKAAEDACWRLFRGQITGEEGVVLRAKLESFLYLLEASHQQDREVTR